jgi:hypothetical protein
MDRPYFDVPPFLMCDRLIQKIAAFGGGVKRDILKAKKGGWGVDILGTGRSPVRGVLAGSVHPASVISSRAPLRNSAELFF